MVSRSTLGLVRTVSVHCKNASSSQCGIRTICTRCKWDCSGAPFSWRVRAKGGGGCSGCNSFFTSMATAQPKKEPHAKDNKKKERGQRDILDNPSLLRFRENSSASHIRRAGDRLREAAHCRARAQVVSASASVRAGTAAEWDGWGANHSRKHRDDAVSC
jgi:hypothetical protein